MLPHLVQKVRGESLVCHVGEVVVVVCMCPRGVRQTLVFNVVYFDWRICDFTDVLMFWEVYVNFAEVFNGDVEIAARLNVHDFFSHHTCMTFGHLLMGNFLYWGYRVCGN